MKCHLFFLALSSFLSGCVVAPPQLTNNVDAYTNERQFALGPIQAHQCADSRDAGGWVDVGFLGSGDLRAMYVALEDSNWKFLDSRQPLDLLIDGKPEQLAALRGETHEVEYGGHVKETLYYPITKEFAERLSRASDVRFRVIGSKGYIEKCLSADQLQTIGQIVHLM